jgi:hypothetical protein
VIAALPVHVPTAIAELEQSGFVERGDAELGAPDDVVMEVVLDDGGHDRWPIAEVEGQERDSTASRPDLVAPDGEEGFKRDHTKSLQ